MALVANNKIDPILIHNKMLQPAKCKLLYFYSFLWQYAK